MLGPRRFGRLLALLAFVSILALVAFPAGARPPQVEVFPESGSVQAARVDAVTVWNANAGQAALDACLAPTNNPLHESRLYAAMHLAIHDALNAIDRRSRPYVFKTGAKPGASPEAAVAAAARDVLVPLLQQLPAPFSGCASGAVAGVDDAYAAALGAIPDGRAKRQGVALGQAAAAAILALRAGDGSDTPLFDTAYPQGTSLASTASHLGSTSRSRRDGPMSPPLSCATARSSARVRRTG